MIEERWALTSEAAARSLARGLPLVFVIASKAAQTVDARETRCYRVTEWSFLYSGGAEGSEVAVVVGPGGVEVRESDVSRWKFWSKSPPICDWRVDSHTALEIGIRSGGELLPSGSLFGALAPFSLRMGNVTGNPAPVWSLPYRFLPEPRYVRADSGHVLVMSSDTPEVFREE